MRSLKMMKTSSAYYEPHCFPKMPPVRQEIVREEYESLYAMLLILGSDLIDYVSLCSVSYAPSTYLPLGTVRAIPMATPARHDYGIAWSFLVDRKISPAISDAV